MVTLCLPESKSREKLYRVTCDCCKQRSFLTMEEERSAVDGAIFLQGWWTQGAVICPQCRELFESYSRSLTDPDYWLDLIPPPVGGYKSVMDFPIEPVLTTRVRFV